MNTILPPALAPYIGQCIQQQSLTLLTSVLDTPTNWLFIRFLLAVLGQQNDQKRSSLQVTSSDGVSKECKVVLFSAYRSFDLWSEIARKNRLNLQNATSLGRLCYIDGLSTRPQDMAGVINLDDLTLKSLTNAFGKAVQSISAPQPTAPIIILIDGLDFLLASQPSTSIAEVQQLLLDLQCSAHNVVIACAADSTLLHNSEASATPLELDHTVFARTLAHNTRWIFQLRPLETGQSKEVSGSVRASRGGAWEAIEGQQDLADGEWLYHLKGDGSVRVWGRGEA